MTPFITDRPSAHISSIGPNSHIPFGLYICPDGSQVLHDRNYVPRHWRAGDGARAEAVPLLPGDLGRWCDHRLHGYFFVSGDHPIGSRSQSKSVKAKVARGETILRKFLEGAPIWPYLIKADAGVTTG